MKVNIIINCISFKALWVYANVNNFLPIKASELKLCVCYLQGKSVAFTNFQPNWTPRNKVGNFCHFICILSLPIVPPPPLDNL